MATEPSEKPSFSPYRQWGIGLHVGLVMLVVLSVVVMANYLSREYYLRLHIGSHSKEPLSPRTVRFLESLTNQVQVTLYYDKDDKFYSTVLDLLNEYRTINSKISLSKVDHLRNPAAAQALKSKYPFLAAGNTKDQIIFDCEGRVKSVDGRALTQTVPVMEPDRTIRAKPVAFAGERSFTAALLAVTSLQPFKAYFLTGHGEHQPDDGGELTGYLKLAAVFKENYIQVETLSLLNTNPIPKDCNLLVVAGPKVAFAPAELERIDDYLNQGGRMLVLFSLLSLKNGEIGLERILAKWGVEVGQNVVVDPDHTSNGQDVIVQSLGNHPIVNPLLNIGLDLVGPRSVGKLRSRPEAASMPQVEEIALSSTNSYLKGAGGNERRSYPVAVAVEKGALKDVIADRGTTRLVVVGDSLFLVNRQIESLAHRDFAGFAANWLVDRPQLLKDVGPRPVDEYRLVLSRTQLEATQWILLAGMPGAVLLVGALVWFQRRR